MDKLISQERTIRDLCDIKDMLVAAGDPFLASIMIRAISCVENQEVVEAVTVSELNEIGRACGFRAEYKSGVLFFKELRPWMK